MREVEFEDRADIKLRGDRMAEDHIREQLSAGSAYPIFGEESGGDADLIHRYEPYWMVDPLDGSFNYARGCGLCAVSIGLLRGDTPVFGVVYDFHRDVMYSGVVAETLRRNGQPVQPCWAKTRAQAASTTGFPSGMSRAPDRVAEFVERVAAFKKVRMLGSAALALAYVAEGVFDVYVEESIRLWDVAAGLALVQAAGGTIKMRPAADGKPMAYDVWAGKAEFFGSFATI